MSNQQAALQALFASIHARGLDRALRHGPSIEGLPESLEREIEQYQRAAVSAEVALAEFGLDSEEL